MKQQNKKQYLDQVRVSWENKGMLGRFYRWLNKKLKGGKSKNAM